MRQDGVAWFYAPLAARFGTMALNPATHLRVQSFRQNTSDLRDLRKLKCLC